METLRQTCVLRTDLVHCGHKIQNNDRNEVKLLRDIEIGKIQVWYTFQVISKAFEKFSINLHGLLIFGERL